jgi:hypothetical protein
MLNGVCGQSFSFAPSDTRVLATVNTLNGSDLRLQWKFAGNSIGPGFNSFVFLKYVASVAVGAAWESRLLLT